MAWPGRVERLTNAFYAWERRGRGWEQHPYAVRLEPPFRPFFGHDTGSSPGIDDGRKPTILASIVGVLLGSSSPTALDDDDEPEAMPCDVDETLREFELSLPPKEVVPAAASIGWLMSLSTCTAPLALEILGTGNLVSVRVTCRDADVSVAQRALRSNFPNVVVGEPSESLEDLGRRNDGAEVSAIEFGLAREFMAPLRIPPATPDPLTPFVGALADVGNDEIGLVQVLFEEVRSPWPESILRAVVTPFGEPFFVDFPELTALAREKVSSSLHATALRIAARTGDAGRSWSIVRAVAGGLSQFGSPRGNEFIPLANDEPSLLETDILRRTTHRCGMLLSAEELASLVHLPSESLRVPELRRERRTTRAAPAEVTRDGVLLGENTHHGETVAVHLPDAVRMRHTHVVGVSGTGKSTLLVNLVLQDMERGAGVGVIDPHGDLIDEILGRVPEERVGDVVLFDPADEEYVVGWNILGATSQGEKDLLASDLVGVFRRLSTSWGDQMTTVLANAILVFLESERGRTLVDLREFLVNERFRREILETVADPHLLSFWATEFPLLVGRKPQAPILTRPNTFLRSKLIRRVVTARENRLDFRRMIDGGGIFLGKLAQGVIGEENAGLLGALLVSKFHQVALSRQDVAAAERRPFSLVIDEFHHVATSSMASLFSGVRKYNLGLTVAHQELYQLHASSPEVERALLANAYTRICFRVGDEDARQLERGFATFASDDLVNLDTGEAICRVGRKDRDFNLRTRPLSPVDATIAAKRRDLVRESSRKRFGSRVEEEAIPSFNHSRPVAGRIEEPGAAAVAERPAPAPKPPPSIPKPSSSTPTTAPLGRGGPEHKYLQELVRQWGQDRGFHAIVEKPILDGKGKVDVALERDDQAIACEIAVTSPLENEIKNVEKCLAAGFDQVAVVSLKKPLLKRLSSALSECLSDEEQARVHLFSPEDLCAFLGDEPPQKAESTVARDTRSTCSIGRRMPMAIGRSRPVPALGWSAGARLTVVRRGSRATWLCTHAPWMRSMLSRTAAPASPTMVSRGTPLPR